MRGGGDDIGVITRVGIFARRDQAGEVGHVDEKNRPHRIGDLAELGEIHDPRVGAASGDDHLRLVFFGEGGEFVVVDEFAILLDAVRHHLVSLAGKIQVMAMGEVSAMGEIEDLVDAENQRETEGEERVHAADHQPVQDLLADHARARSATVRPAAMP